MSWNEVERANSRGESHLGFSVMRRPRGDEMRPQGQIFLIEFLRNGYSLILLGLRKVLLWSWRL